MLGDSLCSGLSVFETANSPVYINAASASVSEFQFSSFPTTNRKVVLQLEANMLRSLLSMGGTRTPEYIFPSVNPELDGPDCRQDCAGCTVKYPAKFKIDTTKPLYGHIKEFSTHALVATGKSDWIEKVKHDKGSLMEAFAQSPVKSRHGVCLLLSTEILHRELLHTLRTDSTLENYGLRVKSAKPRDRCHSSRPRGRQNDHCHASPLIHICRPCGLQRCPRTDPALRRLPRSQPQ